MIDNRQIDDRQIACEKFRATVLMSVVSFKSLGPTLSGLDVVRFFTEEIPYWI